KICIFFLMAAVSTFFLTGCSNNDTITLDECGLKLPLSKKYQDMGLSYVAYGTHLTVHPVAFLTFSDTETVQALYSEAEPIWDTLETADEQEKFAKEFSEKLKVHQKILAEIIVIPTNEYNAYLENGSEDLAFLADMQMLGQKHGNTYMSQIITNTTEGMNADEISRLHECENFIPQVLKKVKFIKPSIPVPDSTLVDENQAAIPSALPKFTSVDIEGNKADNSLFAEKDLTVLNIWGTFCGPCIQEMPELARWEKELPENVQIVGLVCDVNSENDSEGISDAKTILQDAGATFTNIIATDSLNSFLTGVQFVPTTIFVDSKGNVVGDPIVGANMNAYKEAVKSYLSNK
ncbi:MAG TPA: hypothetical protein DCM57_02495, partial [Treponema sp.]|nr:hypothetical protein [Treponema sp.]